MVAKHYYGQSIQLLLMEMHFIPYPGRCFSALTLPSHHHSNQTLYVCEHVCTCVLTHLYVCAHTRGSWENMIEGLVKIMATFLPNLDQEISLKIVQILAQKSCPNLARILPWFTSKSCLKSCLISVSFTVSKIMESCPKSCPESCPKYCQNFVDQRKANMEILWRHYVKSWHGNHWQNTRVL